MELTSGRRMKTSGKNVFNDQSLLLLGVPRVVRHYYLHAILVHKHMSLTSFLTKMMLMMGMLMIMIDSLFGAQASANPWISVRLQYAPPSIFMKGSALISGFDRMFLTWR
jgi:hypothetical protein